MRKRLSVILAALLAVMMVASTAMAAETDDSTDSAGTTLEGRGKLVARGVGSVDLDGKGKVKLRITGDVTIVDHAGDATVWVRPWDRDASALGERSKLDRAEAILNEVLAENPDNPFALLNLGYLYQEADRVDEARKAYQRVIALNPDDKPSQVTVPSLQGSTLVEVAKYNLDLLDSPE